MSKTKKTAIKTETQKKFNKTFIILGIFLAAVLIFIAFSLISDNFKEDLSMNTVKVLVEMENGENFTLELYPDYAPETVANFKKLVEEGFYDGLTFHRVVAGFMAQGGDPQGTGMGGSKDKIKGEFSANGYAQNTLSHKKGVISMARSMDYNSASSQFFICYDDASFLDGQYAAFGKVIDGMDTVNNFLKVERAMNSMGEVATPKTPIIMRHLSVIE